MEENYINKKPNIRDNDIVFSRAIKAGKRIYYLDVKKNRKEELFLAITESKKVVTDEDLQVIQFEKHKIFLYKEDFDRFQDAFNESLDYIRENNTVNLEHYSGRQNENYAKGTESDDFDIIKEEIDLKIDF